MVLNFCGFVRFTKKILTPDDYDMDGCLAFSLLPGIRRARDHWLIYFSLVKFSQLASTAKLFNSEISWSTLILFHLAKNVSGEEIAQHEAPYDFLEGVAHCTLLISEHQVSSGVQGRWKQLKRLLIPVQQLSILRAAREKNFNWTVRNQL